MSVPLVRHNLVRTRDADEARLRGGPAVLRPRADPDRSRRWSGRGAQRLPAGLGRPELPEVRRRGADPAGGVRALLAGSDPADRACGDPHGRSGRALRPSRGVDAVTRRARRHVLGRRERAADRLPGPRHRPATQRPDRRARSRPRLRPRGAPGVAATAELAPADRLRPRGDRCRLRAARDPADPQSARGPDHHRTAQRTTQQRVRSAVRRARPGRPAVRCVRRWR